MLKSTLLLLCSALIAVLVGGSPVAHDFNSALQRRQNGVNYTDPNLNGGQMLTIIPDLDVGEPINVIVSGLSDASVLTIEGFLLWMTSINMGVSCLGQANGTEQSANLGDGTGDRIQGTGNGDNGVLRFNYYNAYLGTCQETFQGGNHLRWWQQAGIDAFFFAVGVEMDLSTSHMIAQNGYNDGRDQLVGNATLSNGTQWEGNVYKTTVEYIPAGVLLNATTDGINHPSIALPGQPAQDGRVAVLTVKQLASPVLVASNSALDSIKVSSIVFTASFVFASALLF